MLLEDLTHGTFAITHTSDKNPDDIEVGEKYTLKGNPHHVVVSKHKNHFKVRNIGSHITWGVAWKGKEAHAKPDYFKKSSKYLGRAGHGK